METSGGWDLNVILVPLAFFSGGLALVMGLVLIVRSFFLMRFEVAQSLNTDLEVVKVSRVKTDETKPKGGEEWREEIKGMEQLLTSLANLKRNVPWWQKLLFTSPHLIFEIANPSSSEEIFFYLSIPKRFRESVEKQIHSFFPQAVIEKVPE